MMSFATTPATAVNPWMQILAALEKKVNRQSFETWLKPTRYSHIAGRTLYVRIPTEEFQHIGDKYSDLVQEAIDLLKLDLEDVAFVTVEEDPSQPPVRKDGGFGPVPTHSMNAPPVNHSGFTERSRRGSYPSQPLEQQSRFDWSTAAQLNPRYTFENFVIGNGNQFARAASLAGQDPSDACHRPRSEAPPAHREHLLRIRRKVHQ
jgi:chromosomal replication initiator protein